MPMSEGAPVTGYRTRLVRITLGNERLVEWIGSFHEASSNFVSIGRARSTASIRRLFFYKAFSEWRPLCLGNADHGSHIVRVPKGPVIPFHIIPFFVPFEPSAFPPPPPPPHSSTVFETSRSDPLFLGLPWNGRIDGLPSEFK